MIIYKTINLINGKIYIGQDSNNNPEYLGSGLLLKKAIRKYGKDKFKKEIIQEGITSIKDLNLAEIYHQRKNPNCFSPIGYNLLHGAWGGNRKGKKHELSSIEKNRIAHLGKSWGKHTKETKKHLSEVHKGKKFTKEHRKNLSISRKKRITKQSTIEKMKKSMIGKNSKKYKLISPNGILHHTVNSLSQFCKKYNLSPQNLMKVLSGERTHHKNWKIERL